MRRYDNVFVGGFSLREKGAVCNSPEEDLASGSVCRGVVARCITYEVRRDGDGFL